VRSLVVAAATVIELSRLKLSHSTAPMGAYASFPAMWARPEVVREHTGEGNDLTFDRQGRLIMCAGGNRCVSQTEVDSCVVTQLDRYRSKRLNQPNDVVCHSDERIYFTDPGMRVPIESM
jgi:sugar lactone lactonase YvrE